MSQDKKTRGKMEALEAQREVLVGKRQQVDAELHALDVERQRALREQQREQATEQQQALIARLREAREQQGKNWSLAACSSGVRYWSRCSGSPASTRVRQVPHTPCSHEVMMSTPWGRSASTMEIPAGMV